MTISLVDRRVSNTNTTRVRIAVADPDPLVRRGLAELLREETGLQIVGKVEDIAGLQETLASQSVDSILIDYTLAQADNYAAISWLREAFPKSQIIVMGTITESESILRLLRLGATGYLPKRGRIDEFRSALRQVLVHMNPLLPDVSQQLLGHLIREGASSETPSAADRLSAREQEVLDCLTQGMCNKEIAMALQVSDRTVKAHVSSILRKLRVADRTQAVLKALRMKGSTAS